MIRGRSWRAIDRERKSGKGKGGREIFAEGIDLTREMDLMEQRILFFDSSPPKPVCGLHLVFKPGGALSLRALGCRHFTVSFGHD